MPCGLLRFVVVHAAVDGAVLRSGGLSKHQKLGITTAAGWGWGRGQVRGGSASGGTPHWPWLAGGSRTSASKRVSKTATLWAACRNVPAKCHVRSIHQPLALRLSAPHGMAQVD